MLQCTQTHSHRKNAITRKQCGTSSCTHSILHLILWVCVYMHMCTFIHTVWCGCVGVGMWVWCGCAGMRGTMCSCYLLSCTLLSRGWWHSGSNKSNPLWNWACKIDIVWVLTRPLAGVAVTCMDGKTTTCSICNKTQENPITLTGYVKSTLGTVQSCSTAGNLWRSTYVRSMSWPQWILSATHIQKSIPHCNNVQNDSATR